MRHGTEAQESAPNPGKAVRGQAKTTATAPFSLPSGAVPVGDAAREAFARANSLVLLGRYKDALAVTRCARAIGS